MDATKMNYKPVTLKLHFQKDHHPSGNIHSSNACDKQSRVKSDTTPSNAGKQPYVMRKPLWKCPSGEKLFECKTCHKQYKFETSLQKHLCPAQYPQKQYPCEMCCKKFNHKYSLTNHLRVHTGEKPYSCDVCHGAFRMMSDLKYHLRFHK